MARKKLEKAKAVSKTEEINEIMRDKKMAAIFDMYSNDEHTVRTCCEAHGYSPAHFYRLVKEFPKYGEAFELAKYVRTVTRIEDLPRRALTGLERRLDGGVIKTTRREFQYIQMEIDGVKQFTPEGDPIMVKKEVGLTETEKDDPPNVGAIIFTLSNTTPHSFQKNGRDAFDASSNEPQAKAELVLPDGTVISL